TNAELSMLDWPASVAGVSGGGAVAVTADSVTLLRADDTQSAPNPCPVPLASYPLWTALYEDGGAESFGELDVACANGQLARTDDFPGPSGRRASERRSTRSETWAGTPLATRLTTRGSRRERQSVSTEG